MLKLGGGGSSILYKDNESDGNSNNNHATKNFSQSNLREDQHLQCMDTSQHPMDRQRQT
jgi:hypothetical protein